VGDFNTLLSSRGRSSRQNTINDTIDQMDLTDVYRVFHPATA
jgi:hypothetical protein